jgi:hypothetical protein
VAAHLRRSQQPIRRCGLAQSTACSTPAFPREALTEKTRRESSHWYVRPIRAPIDVTYGASDVVPASYTQYPFNRLVNPIFNSAIFNTAVSIGDGSASILKESLRLFGS